MLHEVLWEANAETVRCCLLHPFVRGLAEGTLEHEVFKRYIDQDTFFLGAFLRAYALAAAKTDDLAQARLFHRLMLGVLDELKLHADYAEKLSSNARDVKPYPTTSTYTSFLLRTAWHGHLAEIVAAMVPCMRLYTFLGSELVSSLRPEHPYQDWIKTYSVHPVNGEVPPVKGRPRKLPHYANRGKTSSSGGELASARSCFSTVRTALGKLRITGLLAQFDIARSFPQFPRPLLPLPGLDQDLFQPRFQGAGHGIGILIGQSSRRLSQGSGRLPVRDAM